MAVPFSDVLDPEWEIHHKHVAANEMSYRRNHGMAFKDPRLMVEGNIVCIMCGDLSEKTGPRQKFCTKCRYVAGLARAKAGQIRRKKKEMER